MCGLRYKGRCKLVTLVLNSPWIDRDLLRSLARKSTLIAVDGGLNHVHSAGILPDWVLGDFDSVDPEFLAEISGKTRIMRLPREKDFTDMELALKLAVIYRPSRINILGIGGGSRLDHQVTNSIMLSNLARTGVEIIAWGGPQEMFFTSATRILSSSRGRYFSVLALSGPAVVKIRGAKFSGPGIVLYPGSGFGLGNEISRRRAVISVESGVVCISQWKVET
jgi:thiamine pyrophosphokinase